VIALRSPLIRLLTPTDLAGAYVNAGLPDDMGPNDLSQYSLFKHGFYWRKPGHSESELAAVWDHHFGLNWSPAKRIVPQFRVIHGKTHRPVRRSARPLPTSGPANEITNWAGGGVFGTWTSASGSWTVPAVSKPSEGPGADGGWDSSSWVGLDGSGSNDVLQAGVQQSVSASGAASYVAWYEWFCTFQKQTLSDTSPFSPSLVSHQNRLYLAWRGDGNDNLNVMVSSDQGQTFGNKHISPETSDDAPALASDGTNLYIAWKGSGNDHLNVALVALGANGAPVGLVNKRILGDTSPVRPTLATLNGNLYLGWKGDGNDHLNVMVSRDRGNTFGSKLISPETSPEAPALAAHNGGLFISWKGDGNDHLNVARVALDASGNPVATTAKVILGDTSPRSPTLASFNGLLFIGWKGDGNDNLNVMFSSNNGASFGNKFTSPETSPEPPVLAAHAGNLFIGWKGDGNDNLNVSVVGIAAGRITGFTTPPYLFEVQIPNFKVSPGDIVHCSVVYLPDKSAGQVSFGNQTTGANFQITLVPPPGAQMLGNSAEWIMEVPTIGGSLAHLPAFGSVPFTGAISCGPSAAGNPQTGGTFTILNDAGQALTSTTLGNLSVTIRHT
jgi:hypothetical protein